MYDFLWHIYEHQVPYRDVLYIAHMGLEDILRGDRYGGFSRGAGVDLCQYRTKRGLSKLYGTKMLINCTHRKKIISESIRTRMLITGQKDAYQNRV